jgi:hypothetical protein
MTQVYVIYPVSFNQRIDQNFYSNNTNLNPFEYIFKPQYKIDLSDWFFCPIEDLYEDDYETQCLTNMISMLFQAIYNESDKTYENDSDFNNSTLPNFGNKAYSEAPKSANPIPSDFKPSFEQRKDPSQPKVSNSTNDIPKPVNPKSANAESSEKKPVRKEFEQFYSSNPYTRLGLKDGASKQEIRKAFLALSKRYHPDKNNGDEDCAEIFKIVSETYYLLRDAK